MTDFNPIAAMQTSAAPERKATADPTAAAGSDLGKRFEQLLWAEMLSHSGLEEAFTMGGGEAAASFSRYLVEEIARDLADRHPLGLDPLAGPQAAPPEAGVEPVATTEGVKK